MASPQQPENGAQEGRCGPVLWAGFGMLSEGTLGPGEVNGCKVAALGLSIPKGEGEFEAIVAGRSDLHLVRAQRGGSAPEAAGGEGGADRAALGPTADLPPPRPFKEGSCRVDGVGGLEKLGGLGEVVTVRYEDNRLLLADNAGKIAAAPLPGATEREQPPSKRAGGWGGGASVANHWAQQQLEWSTVLSPSVGSLGELGGRPLVERGWGEVRASLWDHGTLCVRGGHKDIVTVDSELNVTRRTPLRSTPTAANLLYKVGGGGGGSGGAAGPPLSAVCEGHLLSLYDSRVQGTGMVHRLAVGYEHLYGIVEPEGGVGNALVVTGASRSVWVIDCLKWQVRQATHNALKYECTTLLPALSLPPPAPAAVPGATAATAAEETAAAAPHAPRQSPCCVYVGGIHSELRCVNIDRQLPRAPVKGSKQQRREQQAKEGKEKGGGGGEGGAPFGTMHADARWLGVSRCPDGNSLCGVSEAGTFYVLEV